MPEQCSESFSGSQATATTVSVEGLTKEFGSVTAVDGISFEIQEGEFFSLLGPSGCGKSTTLRMIAGFEEPLSGMIRLHENEISSVPPYNRDTGMVFQGYALFPHKTVGENVGFGLKMDGIEESKREQRVSEILDLVNLPDVQDRSPDQLSGGQQQRVALARALVIEPSVLLLDEPLSNLDYLLRKKMRFELKRIQEELGITTIYVTHNQEEAMAMSDRVLVMNDGHAEQIDSPSTIYNNPSSEFVADFIGEANLLSARVETVSDELLTLNLTDIDHERVVAAREVAPQSVTEGERVIVSYRPEDASLSPTGEGPSNEFTGEVTARTFLGKSTRYLLSVDGEELLVETSGRTAQPSHTSGDTIPVSWSAYDCTVLQA